MTLRDVSVGDELGGGIIIFQQRFFGRQTKRLWVFITYKKPFYKIYTAGDDNFAHYIYKGKSYKAALGRCWKILKGSISLIHHKK